ncbi:putative PurR-regulated permease PerM [Lachnotalea glycerini]|uniref:AI-2E family transporter n=1 Tax=Lachnotalea glycerini TaxID=1763509 RepID=A0A255I9W0_9FIRM|nr:AI-2E family transporter [Lachnotalea glycerini]PXV85305.1 putative PurR-regulated permease PerM [Lachnotalea glycerini]RDY29873.1 AI-2E family transporter [Lachnotalea glycerini]
MNDIKNNKFESNKKYFTICIYTIFVILVGSIIIKLIMSWEEAVTTINKYASAVSPFLIGAFIAYLINPLMKYFDQKIFTNLLKIKSARKRKYFSLALSYALVIGLIYICFYYIIPQLFTSLTDLIQSIPLFYDKIYEFLNNLETNYPDIDFNYINNLLDKALPNMVDTLKNFVTNAIPLIYSTSVSVIRWLLNIIIAIIVSIYMLSDKNVLQKNFKRFIYAFFPTNFTNNFMKTLGECNKIFSGFIIGKSIDSLIIGIICFVLMSIFKMPYPLVISAIVGVTNMIPYFGPFIGAVPGTIILLLISPLKSLGFIILILVLQQFDGLYLGPKILGNSTGLKPLWIIFAITIGGSLAGVAGMFFGVPLMAVFTYLANQMIEKKLKTKNITINTDSE